MGHSDASKAFQQFRATPEAKALEPWQMEILSNLSWPRMPDVGVYMQLGETLRETVIDEKSG